MRRWRLFLADLAPTFTSQSSGSSFQVRIPHARPHPPTPWTPLRFKHTHPGQLHAQSTIIHHPMYFFFFALHIESGSVHRFSPLASHHLIMANQWLGYGRRVHNSQAEKRRRLCSLGIPAEINQVLRSWCLVPTKVEGSTHTSASLCRLPCSATSMFAGPAHAHESTV